MLFAQSSELGGGIWLTPRARSFARSTTTSSSRYLHWQTLGWDTFERLAGLPMETSISRPYIEHFKRFYADTATFGVEPLLLDQAIAFFGVDRVMFGSDTPMDDRAGETFIPNTLASIEQLGLADEQRRAVLAGTAQRLFAAWLPTAAAT